MVSERSQIPLLLGDVLGRQESSTTVAALEESVLPLDELVSTTRR